MIPYHKVIQWKQNNMSLTSNIWQTTVWIKSWLIIVKSVTSLPLLKKLDPSEFSLASQGVHMFSCSWCNFFCEFHSLHTQTQIWGWTQALSLVPIQDLIQTLIQHHHLQVTTRDLYGCSSPGEMDESFSSVLLTVSRSVSSHWGGQPGLCCFHPYQ